MLLSGIYFFSQNNEFVNIGQSNNIAHRFEHYKIHNPHDMYIIGFIEMVDSTRQERVKKEKELHKQLWIYHKKGEWFYLNDFIINLIIKNKWYLNTNI